MATQQLRATLKSLANKEIAATSQRFFKTGPGEYGEGDVFIGVRVPELRKLAKKCSAFSIEQTTELLHSKIHEERLLAILIWINQYPKADIVLQNDIYSTYLANTAYINNWDIVDISAPHIVGAYCYDKRRIAPLNKLVKSCDIWERRIAIMASFYHIRQNQFEPTLKLAKGLLNDEHDLIHKAVGWMIREIGKRDMKTAEDFLKKHYQTMPRTMLRYAIEHFPNRKRQAYLKGTVT